MAKYIRAELYKAVRRKSLWGTLIVVAALEGLLVGGYVWGGDLLRVTAGDGFFVVVRLLIMGFYGGLLFSDVVFSDQHKYNTLKNEVSFGLPRTRIYLGKLVTGWMVSIVSCVVLIGFYGLLCMAFLPWDGAGAEAIASVGFALLAALPLWLGSQAMVIMLFFLFHSSVAPTILAIMIISFLGDVLNLAAVLASSANQLVGDMLFQLCKVTLTAPLDHIAIRIGEWGVLPRAWAVGLGWAAVTTAFGLWRFRKKEIS